MRQTIRKLQYLLSRREKWQAVALFALMLGGAGLEMLGVGAIPAFVAVLDTPEVLLRYEPVRQIYDALGIASHQEFILWCAGVLLVVFILKNSYLAGLIYLRARYTWRRGVTIGSRLFGAYLRSPYTFHLQRNTADLLRNAHRESQLAVGAVLMPIMRMTMEVLVLGAILVLLFIAEPLVSLVATLTLGAVSGGLYWTLRHRLTRQGEARQYYSGRMIQSINEGLGGIQTTKLLGREEHFRRSFTRNASRFADASIMEAFANGLPRLFIETAAMAGLVLVSVVFIAQGRPLGAILPTLTLFAAASVRLIPSFNRITQAINQIRFGHHAVDVIHADLQALEQPASAKSGSDAPALHLNSAIELHDVYYRYPGAAEEALHGITLTIPRGDAVAFVGSSGAGKTTVVNAILGLLEPTHGEILVDGIDIREHLSGWQRRIGYIPQEIYLTDATIRENIAFGLDADAIDEGAIERAASSAQLDEFVERLPEKLDTIVGERGVRLSGGQRQRIGIARALYHNPEVLMMDEATSHLDSETERYIMQAVERLRGEHTLILIAHRLSTVRNCNRLFLLLDGRLDAVGNYNELIHRSGTFRSMASVAP